ncbi:hypothetical protein LINGRAHAP2_LOCUS17623 [Linum grandiflorum]
MASPPIVPPPSSSSSWLLQVNVKIENGQRQRKIIQIMRMGFPMSNEAQKQWVGREKFETQLGSIWIVYPNLWLGMDSYGFSNIWIKLA